MWLPHGAWCPSPLLSCTPQTQDLTLPRTRRDVTTPATALSRRRLNAQERPNRQHKQAQRDLEALRQALDALGVPADLVSESAGRVRVQKKRLGNLLARRCPTLCGGRKASELTRPRGGDTPLPSRRLGAVPTRAGRKRRRPLGHAGLVSPWRPSETRRDATRSRWHWPGGLDDSVLRPYRSPLEWVGTWWRGQPQRVVEGLDGGLRLVVIGAGTLGVPVAWAGRRPPSQRTRAAVPPHARLGSGQACAAPGSLAPTRSQPASPSGGDRSLVQ